ncbi:bifunctional hydroxymethylpyrimidine kinase/phosphomethylpyrimidine kinase [Pseudolactococcus insecticola]|uniref:Hydroxymethylpyrimidine/phosphomethylpyrimidine kinase n=1 Tax=Pseudolactococcus insecticola TaxID=2709158 RepID=A0A6A0B6Y7_9LACT|nr:bifunctional hydroxymethylpyrimidine kinase/phosphomethylpyrimidine kinase [Lactococcus insecticola]GFH41189.1 hydroxymethylpyrimidine/phosphomethylpyrimidine kinase [Lactococcus insecticola]
MTTFPQVVTIAGSDSDGSAGMQADLHGFFIRDVYGASILTAAVAGNSYGIHDAVNLPTSFIDSEFKALYDDFEILAAKTGMLANAEIIGNVVKNLKTYHKGFLVVDPVIMTKHGNQLLEEAAYESMRKDLIPLADVITPNFYEAQKLAEMTINSDEDQILAAEILQKLGAKNIVVKGCHDDDTQALVKDYLLLENGQGQFLTENYVKTDRINGTGDTFAAVITAELAKNPDVERAVKLAKSVVHAAIASPIEVGHQFGPINHFTGK